MRTKTIAVFILSIFLLTTTAYAQTPSSTNYQVQESTFSSGGDINAQSGSYSAQGAAGILAVGQGDSTSYTARPGYITPNEEYLEIVVQTSSVDLGLLETTTTGTGTALFYVRSYINGSYVVQQANTSLTSEGGAVLTPLATPTASTQGTEQFGVNLVANTSPAIGSNPSPDPDTNFANGQAATNYDTADSFTFNQGDTIAESGPTGLAWGRTNFTISYIANVSTITPAGTYKAEHDLVLVSTY